MINSWTPLTQYHTEERVKNNTEANLIPSSSGLSKEILVEEDPVIYKSHSPNEQNVVDDTDQDRHK